MNDIHGIDLISECSFAYYYFRKPRFSHYFKEFQITVILFLETNECGNTKYQNSWDVEKLIYLIRGSCKGYKINIKSVAFLYTIKELIEKLGK